MCRVQYHGLSEIQVRGDGWDQCELTLTQTIG